MESAMAPLSPSRAVFDRVELRRPLLTANRPRGAILGDSMVPGGRTSPPGSQADGDRWPPGTTTLTPSRTMMNVMFRTSVVVALLALGACGGEGSRPPAGSHPSP